MIYIKLFEDFKPGFIKSPQMATTITQCKNALIHNLSKLSDKKGSLEKEKSKIKNNTKMPDSEKKLWYKAIEELLNEQQD